MRIAVSVLIGLGIAASMLASPAYPAQDFQPAKKMHPRFAGELWSDPNLLAQIEPAGGLEDTLPTENSDSTARIWCRAMDIEAIEVWDNKGNVVDGAAFYVRTCVEE